MQTASVMLAWKTPGGDATVSERNSRSDGECLFDIVLRENEKNHLPVKIGLPFRVSMKNSFYHIRAAQILKF